MKKIIQVQLGKNGITENFMQTLKTHFNNHKNVKVTVLKSARPNKNPVKEYSNEILEKLGKHYTSKVIGFTINLKKWRKEQR